MAGVSDDVATEPSSRRALAVSRTADPARQRAEDRVQAFLYAARELLNSSDGKDFTLQQVVDRSGQSTRSFYQHFAGKDELLLAVFEESMHETTEQIAVALDGIEDPTERLHRFVVEYHHLCLLNTARYADNPLRTRAMALFVQHLLIYRPADATAAFAPLASMVKGLLAAAAESGVLETDTEGEGAGYVLQAVMFSAFAPVIGGISRPDDPAAAADRLWERLIRGLAQHP